MGTSLQNHPRTSVDVTDGGVAVARRWHIVRTSVHQERKVEAYLQSLGLETFLPIQKEMHNWSDRRKLVDRIVIPMIVFVKANTEDLTTLRLHHYDKKLMKHPGTINTFATIPDKQMDDFKFMLEYSETPVAIIDRPIRKGDLVTIVRGSLRGLQGYVTSCEDGQNRFNLILDVFGGAIVYISKENLEQAK